MLITENLIDMKVDATAETYGDLYPDNAAYMSVVNQLIADGAIIERTVTEVNPQMYLVKTTFKDLDAYTAYLTHPEVSKMGFWIKANAEILIKDVYEA